MAEQEEYNPAAGQQAQNPNGQVAPPEINLGDFAVMIAIVDTVAKRGGFEGPELQDVGTLRSRLQTFVDFHKPQDDAGEPPVAPVTQSTDSAESETLDFDEAEEMSADGEAEA
jgi:hypothetical protein